MRLSEFWALMEQAFGDGYDHVVAGSVALTDLGSRTAAQALEDGERPRDVWEILCAQLDLPAEQRHLPDARPRGSTGRDRPTATDWPA